MRPLMVPLCLSWSFISGLKLFDIASRLSIIMGALVADWLLIVLRIRTKIRRFLAFKMLFRDSSYP